MSDDRADARTRVRALIDAAARIADPSSALGRRARAELPGATGLSPAGVELALRECLETRVADAELDVFCAAVTPVPAAHVLLSANVFVAAHRAIALALAASERVRVRPSRREPTFARLLAEAAPGLFETAGDLAPMEGDAVFAFGTDETLATVRANLRPNVAFHAHGSGIGIAVVETSEATPEVARAIARDVVPFDQRGCLSPRTVLFIGAASAARAFAELAARELEASAHEVPLGVLSAGEAADVTRFRDAFTYAGELLPAGPGWLAMTARNELVVAPTGRNLTVTACDDAVELIRPQAGNVAALGLGASLALSEELRAAFPFARTSAIGRMQRPAFDGPVDRRSMPK